ncbi:putative secreted protein, signal peptide [Cryptosporidium felis]|nr:putative secreted protein, signal peptide [Cryptosporidium felis]
MWVFWLNFVLLLVGLMEGIEIDESEKLARGLDFLRGICEKMGLRNSENLSVCYNSNIYFGDYLWVTAYLLEEWKDYQVQMILPREFGVGTRNCREINSEQCITSANFGVQGTSISVKYTEPESMIVPINSQCRLRSLNDDSNLNILWMEEEEKVSLLTQSVILGKGYQELFQFENPLEDISNIICYNVKAYLMTENYRNKLRAVISRLIGSFTQIRDAIYVRVPMENDWKVDVSGIPCQEISESLAAIDRVGQIRIDLGRKSLVVQKDSVKDLCHPENENGKINILSWRVDA